MTKITWLASYPKSGNTWLRLLLSAYFNGGYVDINNIHHSVSDLSKMYHMMASPMDLSLLYPEDFLALRYSVLLHIRTAAKLSPVFVKTHNADKTIIGYPLIPGPMTQCAIYIVRDPRDVAVSYSEHLGKSLDEIIELMTDESEVKHINTPDNPAMHFPLSWSQNVSSWDACDRFPVLAVRYEELLEDAATVLEAVLSFSGIKPDEQKILAAVQACSFDRISRQEKARKFAEASEHTDTFFKRGTSGHWTEYLSPSQASKIEASCAEMMEKYGYLSSIRNAA